MSCAPTSFGIHLVESPPVLRLECPRDRRRVLLQGHGDQLRVLGARARLHVFDRVISGRTEDQLGF